MHRFHSVKPALSRSISSVRRHMSDSKHTIVLAMGGNALLPQKTAPTYQNQLKQIRKVAPILANVVKSNPDTRLVLTHGNGPQVGLLALQNLAYTEVPPYPLDVLVAETAGQIGLTLAQELRNSLRSIKAPVQTVVSLLTQVRVDPNDPWFGNPTKYLGPGYSREESEIIAAKYDHWVMKQNMEGRYRRVVPSPLPQEIVEISEIKTLVDSGSLVIALGGGGVSVVADEKGNLSGVEAVVDKDLSSALLASELQADALVILTDVPHCYDKYHTADEKAIGQISVTELEAINSARPFANGSMGPKIQACINFVNQGQGENRYAAIGRLDDLEDILSRTKGTIVTAH